MELADLHELDFASRKPSQPGNFGWREAPDLENGQVLTLERLLGVVADAGRPVPLHVETKHPTRYGGRVERALLELLGRHGLLAPGGSEASRVAVLSYSVTSLRRVHAQAPGLPTVLNTDFVLPWLRGGRLPAGVAALGLALRAARACPDVVRRVRAQHRRVQVFTVNEPHDLDYLRGLGVDAVITNHPARVLQQLSRS